MRKNLTDRQKSLQMKKRLVNLIKVAHPERKEWDDPEKKMSARDDPNDGRRVLRSLKKLTTTTIEVVSDDEYVNPSIMNKNFSSGSGSNVSSSKRENDDHSNDPSASTSSAQYTFTKRMRGGENLIEESSSDESDGNSDNGSIGSTFNDAVSTDTEAGTNSEIDDGEGKSSQEKLKEPTTALSDEDDVDDPEWDNGGDPGIVDGKWFFPRGDADADKIFRMIADQSNLSTRCQENILKFIAKLVETKASLSKTHYRHLKKIDKLVCVRKKRIVKCLLCDTLRRYDPKVDSKCTSSKCSQLKATVMDVVRAKESQIVVFSLKDLLQQLVLGKTSCSASTFY